LVTGVQTCALPIFEADVVEGHAEGAARGRQRVDEPAQGWAQLGNDPELLGAGGHDHGPASTAAWPVRASYRRTNSASESAVKASRRIPLVRMACSMAAGSPSTSSSGSMRGYCSSLTVAPSRSYTSTSRSTTCTHSSP